MGMRTLFAVTVAVAGIQTVAAAEATSDQTAAAAPVASAPVGASADAAADAATVTPAAKGPASPAAAASEAQLDTIVVTGLRDSLQKSLALKKNADVVLDSINATELGRFPDDNVADSLSHINGISITRTTGGEGQHVSVRGLPSQYNIVTLNNRILATDDDGRDFAFDVLPADVISGADVLKSAQASAVEGSIGGTVNLRSARPFDDPGFHSALRAEKNYNDMSYFSGYKLSGVVSNTSEDGKFGVLVGAVLSDTKTRTDALNYNTYDPANPGVWPLGSNNAVVGECCISYGTVIDQKKRDALSGTVEWRPTGDIKIAADALFTRLNDPQVAYNHSFYPDFGYDQNGNSEWSNVVVKNGLVTSFTANTFTPEVVNNTIDRVVNTSLLGLNGSWQVNSRLSFAGDLYRSRAIRPEGGTDAFVTAGLVSPGPYNQSTITYTANQNAMPNISIRLPNGQDYATALATGQLTNQNLWSTHYVGLSGYTIHDAVTGATADGSYKVDQGIFERIDFGIGRTRREKSRWDVSNDWTNGSAQYGTLYNTVPGQPGPITFGTMGANVISMTNFPNFMQGAGGSFPTTMPVLNVPALLAGLQKLNGTTNYSGTGATYQFSNTLPQFNPTNSYAVSESTTSLYGEAFFAGDNWTGNLGLRIVRTNTQASTSVDNIQSVTVADTTNPTNPGIVAYSAPTPTTAYGSYTIPLPSINTSYWLNQKLQLRFGAAEVMSRPNLNQLAPTVTNNAGNQQYILYYAGNAALKPIKATQADLSAEWYYQPKAALTAAVFGKKLRDDITTQQINNVNIGAVGLFNGNPAVPLPFDVQQPVNGDRSLIYGIELGWQHILESGFGIRAQYAYTWSKTWIGGQYAGAESGISPSTASVGLLYEAGKISSSISWDYAGHFNLAGGDSTEVTGWPAISNSFTWVTASASYQLTKEIKLYVEGKNLTDSVAKTFLNGNPYAIWANGSSSTSSGVGAGYSDYGRSYTAGIGIRF
jgi:TonB-dependent receptor